MKEIHRESHLSALRSDVEDEPGLLLAGALRIARAHEESKIPYIRAQSVAEEAAKSLGAEGILERDLFDRVQETAEVIREIAVYSVVELCSNGLVRRDRDKSWLYPVPAVDQE